MVPSLLFISTVLGIKNIIVQSINEQPYELWALPGLILFLGALLITPLLYRDFFDLRIHEKALVPMTLTPVQKSTIIMGLLFSSALEVLCMQIIGLGIYSVIFPGIVTLKNSIYIIIYGLFFTLLYGNFIIFLSMLTQQITIFISAVLVFLVIIFFISGIAFELDFFPITLHEVFKYLPLGMIVAGLHSLLFLNRFDMLNAVIPGLWIVLLIILNSLILKWKMKQ